MSYTVTRLTALERDVLGVRQTSFRYAVDKVDTGEPIALAVTRKDAKRIADALNASETP